MSKFELIEDEATYKDIRVFVIQGNGDKCKNMKKQHLMETPAASEKAVEMNMRAAFR